MAEMISHFVFPDPQATLRNIIVSQGFSRSNDMIFRLEHPQLMIINEEDFELQSVGRSMTIQIILDNYYWDYYTIVMILINMVLYWVLQPGFQFAVVTRESGYLLHRGVW